MESKLSNNRIKTAEELASLTAITGHRQVKPRDKVICILVPRDNHPNSELVLGGTYTVVESIASPYGFVGRDLVELAGDGGCYHCYRFALAPKEETKEETRQGNN